MMVSLFFPDFPQKLQALEALGIFANPKWMGAQEAMICKNPKNCGLHEIWET